MEKLNIEQETIEAGEVYYQCSGCGKVYNSITCEWGSEEEIKAINPMFTRRTVMGYHSKNCIVNYLSEKMKGRSIDDQGKRFTEMKNELEELLEEGAFLFPCNEDTTSTQGYINRLIAACKVDEDLIMRSMGITKRDLDEEYGEIPFIEDRDIEGINESDFIQLKGGTKTK